MNFVSTITESVQIYKMNAVVTRKGTVSLTSGRNRIMITGLTNSAVHESLRMQFPESVSASDIQIRDFRNNEKTSSRSEVIQDEIEILDQRISSLQTEKDLLKQNGLFTQRRDFDEEKILSYLSALPERLNSISEEIRQLKKELELKRKDLAEEQKKECLPVIEMELYAEKDIPQCPFIIQYQENAVSWAPCYEIHYNGEDKPLSIKMRARIIQQTGEDWEDISVSLFTGDPILANSLPDPQPLKLGLWSPASIPMPPRPVYYSSDSSSKMSLPAPMASRQDDPFTLSEDTADVPVIPLEMQVSEENSLDTMNSWLLPDRKNIASGSSGNLSDLKTYHIKARILRIAYPQHGHFAWLAAEISVSEWPMPDAKASIYLNNTYAGEVFVSPDKTREKMLLSLGADERIHVNREKVTDQVSDVFLRSRKTRKTVYKITVSGDMEEKTEIEIRDQIPVSADKTVEIDPENISGGILNEETGEVIWNASISRNASAVRELVYTVSWPKDKTLQEFKPAGRKGGRRFCLNCGSVMDPDTLFCHKCGAKAY